MLTDQQINKLAAKLHDLKASLSDALSISSDAAQPVELDQTVQGRVSRGDALQQQAMVKANRALNQKRLKHVCEALKRIELEEYGECTECGEEIALARLNIMPDVAQCIQCQEKQETSP